VKLRTLAAFLLAAVLAVPTAYAQVDPGGGGSGSGVKAKGVWAAGTAYRVGDLVYYTSATGASYLCIVNSPAGTLPTDVTKWAKVGILAGASKLLDVTFGDVTTGDPTRGDVIVAQGASPKWAKKAKGAAGDLFVMGANEPGWAGTLETAFKIQTVAAPTAAGAVCNAGVSGVTVDRYFQITSTDPTAAESLPGPEFSVLACPDDSTITVSWTPADGASGVTIHWGSATGAKSRAYQEITEDTTRTSIEFTILTGAASPNLEDDSAAGTSLPVVANARGFHYDFGAGWAFGSTIWATDLWAGADLWLTAGLAKVRAGADAPTMNCSKGWAYYRTNGAADSTAYLCTAVNTWTPTAAVPGAWTSEPFAAGNFTVVAGGATWTVEAADQLTFKYTKQGSVMTVAVVLSNTTISGVASSSALIIKIPGGYEAVTGNAFGTLYLRDNTVAGTGFLFTGTTVPNAAPTPYISLKMTSGANWALSADATSIYFTFTFEVQ
jgi:hypothetical protein